MRMQQNKNIVMIAPSTKKDMDVAKHEAHLFADHYQTSFVVTQDYNGPYFLMPDYIAYRDGRTIIYRTHPEKNDDPIFY
jgi:hypothetical protein